MTSTPHSMDRAQAGAGWVLFLLLMINVFNYIDRQLLAAVEPSIRRSLLEKETAVSDPGIGSVPESGVVQPIEDVGSEAAPAKTSGGSLFSSQYGKMGLLSTAFLVTYMLSSPIFGWLAERSRRWLWIAVGVTLWSFASGVSGLAMTFGMLLLTRCFVGIGEGAYGPIAPAMLSDCFPVKSRGLVLSCFYLAMPVGGALGYAIGDFFAKWNPAAESWRWGFYAVVIPGLLLGLWSFLMRDPIRGCSDGAESPTRTLRLCDYLILAKTPSYLLNTAGMTAMTFAIGALSFWMPAYLQDIRGVSSVWGIPPVTFFGIVTAVAGLFATLLGGIAGDFFRRWCSGSYFLVSAIGMFCCAGCIVAIVYVPFPTAWIWVFLAVFSLFFNTGPTNTIIANVTHPAMRATGFAITILVIHTLGDVISPPIVGLIADRVSFDAGFLFMAFFTFLGGLFWLAGTKFLQRDTERAVHRFDLHS
ncbi:MAG: MFS transporter [Thermoguttaceae bacterium]|nr:MFS transporter [Thermoguttaceae bacterium]